MKNLCARLEALRERPGYDIDYLAPTPAVIEAARRLVQGVPCDQPTPSISPIGDGGLLIQWKHAGWKVQAVIPPTDPSDGSIYFRDGEQDGLSPATPDILARRLEWLALSREQR